MDQKLIANDILNGLLDYMVSSKDYSKNTLEAYHLDLIQYFRFLMRRFKKVDESLPFDEIPISEVDTSMVTSVKLPDIYAFLSYAGTERQNSNKTRLRKGSALRKLYHYLDVVLDLRFDNPMNKVELPRKEKAAPVYMTLDEAKSLLNAVSGRNQIRDLAIITIFLNCGLRLSELTGLKLSDIQDETMHIHGKGNKKRDIQLNDACINAMNDWLSIRPKDTDEPWVFLIKRGGKYQQMGSRGIEQMFKKTALRAGLDADKLSVHKMRHTAATLMLKYGETNIRTLQKVLGHESIATTEIYTHVDNEDVRQALYNNPLNNFVPENR